MAKYKADEEERIARMLHQGFETASAYCKVIQRIQFNLTKNITLENATKDACKDFGVDVEEFNSFLTTNKGINFQNYMETIYRT
jgi:hypothetical protein